MAVIIICKDPDGVLIRATTLEIVEKLKTKNCKVILALHGRDIAVDQAVDIITAREYLSKKYKSKE